MGFSAVAQPGAAPVCLVTDHGAVADDGALDTEAVQATLDACHARGGGTVWVPAGTFDIGTIYPRSHVRLHLDGGAVLKGSPRMADYDADHPHLLYAEGVEHAALTGTGTIDGNGSAFWDDDFEPRERPWKWLVYENARHLTIRDVRLTNSPSHTLNLNYSRYVTVDGIDIENPPRSPNTDGIGVRGTTDVTISNVTIRTGDDAIVLKAGRAPVERVTITNALLESDDAAFKLGTGSATVTRDIVFANSVVTNSRYGVALFMKGGGVYERIRVADVRFEGGSRHRIEYPVYVDVDRLTPETPVGAVRDLVFADLDIRTTGKLLLAGHPESPLERVAFDDVRITVVEGEDFAGVRKPKGNKDHGYDDRGIDFAPVAAHVTLGHARDVTFTDVTVRTD
ncbi:MAG: glycosyl hydrolase family 28 protein, partial [Bacteroidota bacterium]